MHDLPLITTIAVGFVAAWVLGLLTQRLGFSPIVGYLLAGIVVGPNTRGFAADPKIAHELAEVGVILLMFGVGLHFHLKDLLAVKAVAIPGAVGQSIVATILGMWAFTAFGFTPTTSAVIGMAMAVASTVVLMRVLMDADVLASAEGHIAVGWLLVEDVFTVVVLVLIPVLDPGPGGGEAGAVSAADLFSSFGVALGKLGVLVAIVAVVGRRVVPWVLVQVARLRSRELFTLTVLVFSISTAAAAYAAFGASMALGAFLAGMLVAQSPVSHQAAADALPMRDAFAVIFFVSVGMLFDPMFLIQEPLMVLAALAIILLAKPLAALIIVAVLGRSVHTALTVALGLAQIGEFSFILSDLARKHNLMPDEGHNVLIAAAIVSITINPLLFRWIGPIEAWLRRHPRLWKLLNGRADRRAQALNRDAKEQIAVEATDGKRHAIVVGYGPVGRSVYRLLTDAGLSTVVIDMNMDTVSQLQADGQPAIFGDASHESILESAGMKTASYLVLTLPQSSARVSVVTAARHLNADARIFVRAHYLSERDYLEDAGATAAVFEEGEAAVALTKLVLADTGAHRDVVEHQVRDLRLHLILENVSAIRTQRVRSMMIPWPRVRTISSEATRAEVLHNLAQHPHSHWPVKDGSGRPVGYILARDLKSSSPTDDSWVHLIRPMKAVAPDDDIETTLLDLRNDRDAVRLVEQGGEPIGLVTLDDILDHVVGRVKRERPVDATSLAEALAAGAVVLDMRARTADEAIAELAAAIPATALPANASVCSIAQQRERDISTDLGIGVAIPHARCPHLTRPVMVFGRSASGIHFGDSTENGNGEPVRLVFLVVTPAELPETQLALLAQISQLVSNPKARERLLRAETAQYVVETL
jgi:CPA2 family monovalent cation:H+ antiporter-2